MKLSVVIPCRNERAFIKECVNAIFACELPPNCDMQVYVVDGMSDDGTRETISELMTTNGRISLIDNPKKLTPFAFNLGIHAGGKVDFVQIVGARHILSSNYLSRCLEVLQQNTEIWCVGGKINNVAINKTGE
jgi:glycosyltransferase involved in cell wall biosynthesis